MKKIIYFLLVFIAASLSSCAAIGDIFKAGVWVGILVVALVVGIIIFVVSKAGGKN